MVKLQNKTHIILAVISILIVAIAAAMFVKIYSIAEFIPSLVIYIPAFLISLVTEIFGFSLFYSDTIGYDPILSRFGIVLTLIVNIATIYGLAYWIAYIKSNKK